MGDYAYIYKKWLVVTENYSYYFTLCYWKPVENDNNEKVNAFVTFKISVKEEKKSSVWKSFGIWYIFINTI